MPPNLHHLKSLIVDSPRHGKDKIGRIPAGQDAGPPPEEEVAPQYILNPQKKGSGHGVQETPLASVSSTQKKIPATWQGSSSAAHRPPLVPPKDDRSQPSSVYEHKSQLPPSGDISVVTHRPVHPARSLSITSVNSLSRLSFSSQIKQLVLIQLPEATALSNSISKKSTAPEVARTLSDTGSQIQLWITKGFDVLEGLDAGDDAEWAAAAGRDGLHEVDAAIRRFQSLIQVYIAAVEDSQVRNDISLVADGELQLIAHQVEKIAMEWQAIKKKLQTIQKQVELAMEWEALRDSIFQDIGAEIEVLRRQIFEMEEQRHMANLAVASSESLAGVDISELETIVEEAPTNPNRLLTSKLHPFPISSSTPGPGAPDDAKLLGLFARMQPLRALLDFLPMRILTFQGRARWTFPTACHNLGNIQGSMEDDFARLESDAESLRRELGEDRWVLVFRNAGRQAQKMMDSVGRSIAKLDESLDSNTALRHAPGTLKKIENYEAKKTHYCPAVERVLAIVDRGVKDRLTVNGEILRLQHDLQSRWQTIKTDIKNMDSTLDSYEHFRTKQLRDSISSIMSSDPSFLSSALETPGDSSSASSTHTPDRRLSDAGVLHETHLVFPNGKPRQQSSSSTSSRPALHLTPSERRFASSPITIPTRSHLPQARHMSLMKAPATNTQDRRSASLSPSNQNQNPRTSIRNVSTLRSTTTAPQNNRPRWNGSYTPSTTFAYEHPHPGHATRKSSSVQRPTSSLANTGSKQPISSHSSPRTTAAPHNMLVSKRPSSTLTTPSTFSSARTPRSAPAASIAASSSAPGQSFNKSSFDTHYTVGQEPASPSPSNGTLNSRRLPGLSTSRSSSALGKRRSLIPLPTGEKEHTMTEQVTSPPLDPRPDSRFHRRNLAVEAARF